MAGEYLTAAEEAAYGRYAHDAPEQSVLERFFFLDDLDREMVAKRRGDHNRLGFGLQLVTRNVIWVPSWMIPWMFQPLLPG